MKCAKKFSRFCDKAAELIANDPEFARRARGALAADMVARAKTKIRCHKCGQWIEMGTYCGCSASG